MGVAIKNPLARLLPEQREAQPVDKRNKQQRGRSAAKAPARRQPRSTAKGATRQRAAAVQKAPRSFVWLNRILILLGAGVVLVAALKAYIALQAIPVERISVSGELNHTRTTAVQQMVQPALAGGFLGADLQRVREQLEALPWIYEANVRRRWPNALEIHVVEQLPIARWGEDGFLNHEGEVFRPSDGQAWQSLPLLAGPEGTAESLMASYRRIGEMLAPLHLKVEQLLVDERGEVEAVLAGGIRLVLGSEDFLERMRRFVRVYRTELAPVAGRVQRVDLRYADGVAVAFAELPAEPAATVK
jgi:cell division protein FtsQ